jgi:hypothetical protein
MAASENQDPYPCSQIMPDVSNLFWKKVFFTQGNLETGQTFAVEILLYNV